jgi:hypothetical protein
MQETALNSLMMFDDGSPVFLCNLGLLQKGQVRSAEVQRSYLVALVGSITT